MTVKEFHKARLMFIVINGTVLIAPSGTSKSHKEWLLDLFGEERTRKLIHHCERGYVLNGYFRVYRGARFNRKVRREAARRAIEVLNTQVGILRIGEGVVKTETQPWPAAETFAVFAY